MTKQKLIFLILGLLLLGAIFLLVINLRNSGGPQRNITPGDLSIWIYEDSEDDFKKIVDAFKNSVSGYSSKNIEISSFENLSSYEDSLASALLAEKGPDIFMLRSGHYMTAENATQVIAREYISPNDFRSRAHPFIAEELIFTDSDDRAQEYVIGVPLGYETLGVLYNRRYFTKPSEMTQWGLFLQNIQKVLNRPGNITPIALGNGSGVSRVADVIASLFVSDGVTGISSAASSQIRQALTFYKAFGEQSGDNGYNETYSSRMQEVDIDAFTSGEVAAMVGFPRDIQKIDRIGYQSNFLFASPFPKYEGQDSWQHVRVNSLSLNTNSQNKSLAQEFLAFIASREGQSEIQKALPYYIPAYSSLQEEILEEKIYPQYNIVYKNFLSKEARYTTFNMKNETLFRTKIANILDMERGYEGAFESLKSFITCSHQKIAFQQNLSSSCR